MLLVRKESQSAQVAKLLEKQIVSGQITPETKLSSTRELADLFSVSQQVIKSAMNLLEEKNLILRKSRKGIYVAPTAYSPKKWEIVSLRVGNVHYITDYAEKFFASSGRDSYKNLDFIIKSIAPENFSEHSFTYELAKLAETPPDCILISIPQLTEKQVKQCLALPSPVVFIGDFVEESFPGLQYNQIIEDTAERARAALTKAVELGHKEIACIAGPLHCHYNRLYHEESLAVAKEHGVNIHYIEHTDGEIVPEDVIQRRIDTVKGSLDTIKNADAIVIDGFQRLDWFPTVFEQCGLEFPGSKTVIADGDMVPGCIYMQSDYGDLAKAAFEQIQNVILNPTNTEKLVLSGLIKRRFLTIS